MPGVLELAQLGEDHAPAEVHSSGRGVQPELDAQRPVRGPASASRRSEVLARGQESTALREERAKVVRHTIGREDTRAAPGFPGTKRGARPN